MKKLISLVGRPIKQLLFWAILLLVSPLTSLADVRVAVTPFEAGDYALRKYGDYARGELENLILNFGNVQIVERTRMDSMGEELSFGNLSGMADPNQIAQFGRMSGAKILVIGSILKADTGEKSFGGFGISTRSSQTIATVRIRVLDIQKGTVVYSTTVKGSSSNISTSYGGSGQRDGRSAAIEDALKNLGTDQKFKELFTKLDSQNDAEIVKVKLDVAPVPDNCDLEINGVYYGSTPASLELIPGNAVTVKITKAGYLAWEKTLSPTVGMRITPELEKKPAN